jgi:hypothetical protein
MHDAVSDGVDRRADWMRLEKVQQEADRGLVIGGRKGRETCDTRAASWTTRLVPRRPMRSIFPASRRTSVAPVS